MPCPVLNSPSPVDSTLPSWAVTLVSRMEHGGWPVGASHSVIGGVPEEPTPATTALISVFWNREPIKPVAFSTQRGSSEK